ncbi:hypothetical protein [Microbacterium sp. 77mftsu3.1]|uniref:hypothetical protein n=1 Tax=Microbacterium sp. 77mftsu3.1 TaxID=1761802 RepID=UPI0003649F67|nr:hypothetical protein [Microbacterium sp. 77mftsu3.1]SDH43038.1 hypothetical protein SAMN04488590_3324 [Microbacterium sp. 77mftsu3.1]
MTYVMPDFTDFLNDRTPYIEGLTERGNVFRVEVVQMDPERAERILDGNTRNRSLKHDRQKNYAGQMREGIWYVDGNTICIDRDGVLLDGQHRLRGIVESGTTQTVILVTGLEPQAMNSIDTGASRTLGDLLKLSIPDMKHEAKLGALSRVLYIRSLGEDLPTSFATSASAIAQDHRVTNAKIIDFYARQRIIIDRLFKAGESVRRARPTWRGFSSRTISVVRAEFEALDYDDADFFFERLKDGAGLEVNSPIMALIRYGDRLATSRDSSPSSQVWAAMLVKAWNAYREGRPVHNLSFRAGGASPETFPTPV